MVRPNFADLTSLSDGLYWIDPVFNTTNSTSGTTSLLANTAAPLSGTGDGFGAAANVSAGTRFQSSQAGYIVQARVYKQAQDTSTSVQVFLSDDSGNQIGATTISYSSGDTGWQTANFSPAVSIQANTYYQIWILTGTGGGYAYRNGFFRNYSLRNGPLSTAASFAATNNACDTSDAWPHTTDGRSSGAASITAVAIVGCVDINTSGAIAATIGANTSNTSWNLAEGSQVMQGGEGPGPYAVLNSVINNSGNQWHHDDAGDTG